MRLCLPAILTQAMGWARLVPVANSVNKDFVSAVQSGQAYIPVRICSLRLDTITDFDLYLQVRPDEPLVLYAERNIPFTEEARNRLVQSRVECIYIPAEQEVEYRGYLEKQLQSILSDPEIGNAEKAEILLVSAQGLAKDVLDNPRMEGGIDRSKELVQNTVDFLFSQPAALRHLIETASFDYFTYTHSVNACVYSIALAQRAGYKDAMLLREFGNGVLLRDVGMGQIDSKIVENPGNLTFEQYEILKQHPILGHELLQELGGLTNLALNVVLHHHEKMNGAGYPDNLRGDQIHPLIRICTITDIFNALSTNRPYRKALGSYESLKLMGTDMRDELDPQFFRTFIDMMGNPD